MPERNLKISRGQALMFVYGTLRPGEANFWIESALSWYVEGCVTPGKVYYHLSGAYPVADFTQRGEITGALLCFDSSAYDERDLSPNPQSLYAQARSMELGAGYTSRQVVVKLPASLGSVTAEAWHYRGHRGPVIVGGDWKYRQQWRPQSYNPRQNWWEEVAR